jgi:histone-lysine N-methyltransferase SETMAR
MEKSHYRFYIQVRQSLGINAKAIFDELKSFSSRLAPLYATVKHWFRKFRRGHKNFEDESRSGRPKTESLPDNIETIHNLIEDDLYITYDIIEAKTSISRGTIHTIIHDHLKLRKITSRWVPHELTQENKDNRVRICKENLAKFESGKWRLCDVLSDDESWFFLKQVH